MLCLSALLQNPPNINGSIVCWKKHVCAMRSFSMQHFSKPAFLKSGKCKPQTIAVSSVHTCASFQFTSAWLQGGTGSGFKMASTTALYWQTSCKDIPAVLSQLASADEDGVGTPICRSLFNQHFLTNFFPTLASLRLCLLCGAFS